MHHPVCCSKASKSKRASKRASASGGNVTLLCVLLDSSQRAGEQTHAGVYCATLHTARAQESIVHYPMCCSKAGEGNQASEDTVNAQRTTVGHYPACCSKNQ